MQGCSYKLRPQYPWECNLLSLTQRMLPCEVTKKGMQTSENAVFIPKAARLSVGPAACAAAGGCGRGRHAAARQPLGGGTGGAPLHVRRSAGYRAALHWHGTLPQVMHSDHLQECWTSSECYGALQLECFLHRAMGQEAARDSRRERAR